MCGVNIVLTQKGSQAQPKSAKPLPQELTQCIKKESKVGERYRSLTVGLAPMLAQWQNSLISNQWPGKMSNYCWPCALALLWKNQNWKDNNNMNSKSLPTFHSHVLSVHVMHSSWKAFFFLPNETEFFLWMLFLPQNTPNPHNYINSASETS